MSAKNATQHQEKENPESRLNSFFSISLLLFLEISPLYNLARPDLWLRKAPVAFFSWVGQRKGDNSHVELNSDEKCFHSPEAEVRAAVLQMSDRLIL